MSELSNSKCHFSTLISDLFLLCSFILSHPLYFSYFIFFSPYLLKLLSFLSPLFITTFLLSLAFLIHAESSQTRLTHLRLKRDNQNDEPQSLEDLGMYEILFGSVIEVREDSTMEVKSEEDLGIDEGDDFAVNKVDIDSSVSTKLENNCAEKRLENFLKILDEFEKMSSNVEEKKKIGTKAGKVEKPKAESLISNGSEEINDVSKVSVNNSTSFVKAQSQIITSIVDHNAVDYDRKSTSKSESFRALDVNNSTSLVKAQSQRITATVDHAEDYDRESNMKSESSRVLEANKLGNYGSMRKDKEWKRTLACKLFEERHNVGGGEGMDSLWEAYDIDSNKSTKPQNDRKKRNKKKSEMEEYEDEEISGQLCCLQALKLSAGKMNLGIGRPNLVKISKAIKGIGWLHHVSKHSKKVHNNGDRY